jgi:hypothetical protein
MGLMKSLLCGATLLVLAGPLAAAESALVIEADSLAARQVIALGRQLVVNGTVTSDAAVVGADAVVGGEVRGDLIVLGGDARLGPAAVVGGDVFVLGGRLDADRGARIGGRSVSYPTIGSAWLTLLEGPSLGLSPISPIVLGAKLALLAGWVALTLGFFAVAGGGVLSTSRAVGDEPFRNFFVGLTGVLATFLTALLFAALAATLAGAPMLVLVVLLALVLKLWGMTAVFHALGAWVLNALGKRLTPLNAALLGLVILGAIKLIPFVGTWCWTVATFIGVGATLTTKFGRREPWFETAAA